MFKKLTNIGLFKKTIIPVIILNFIMVLFVSTTLHKKTRENTINMASDFAVEIINQYKIVRAYYTKNIVNKVKENGHLKIDYKHVGIPDTIPLPATLIHDLSEEFKKNKNNLELNIYSAYPFPNRAERILDEFQKSALTALKKNPAEPYIKTFLDGDVKRVRVAIADVMTEKACVNCHNTHPETPKNDWALGDIRGVLEVNSVINKSIDDSIQMTKTISMIIILTSIVIVLLLGIVISKLFFKPVSSLLAGLEENSNFSKKQCYDIQKHTDDVRDRLADQSSAVQETTSTLEEIKAMLSKSSTEVERTTTQSNENVSEANQGVSTAQDAVATIRDLGENNTKMETTLNNNNENLQEIVNVIKRISDKAAIINDIVFQTKLLSFNASVEAARSGEHGKGFAVVAEEIGNLAQMSGSAAEEIAGIINEGVSKIETIMVKTREFAQELIKTGNMKVERGAVVIAKCEDILLDISRNSQQTQISMSSINDAYNEQSIGVENISEAMNDLNKKISSNLTSMKETANKSDQLKENADKIDELVKLMHSLIFGDK